MSVSLINERVVYKGNLPTLNGRAGLVLGVRSAPGSQLKDDRADVRFDHDPRRVRVVMISSLTREGESIMKNFKTLVAESVARLLAPRGTDSAKERAVRRLGVAAQLVSLGEADKKKAKAELTTLGIITGDVQNGVVFDSDNYVMTAKTGAASTRLDGTALNAALNAEGFSQAMIRRIESASSVTSKAPVSFTVESK